MNEFTPGATPSPAPAQSQVYYDRSTGLMIFGVLTIMLGILSFLCAVLVVASQILVSFAQIPNAPPTNPMMLIPSIVLYVGLAVALVWLGIGSIKARRWARALLLIFSWSWLLTGVIVIGAMALMFPSIINNMPQPPSGSGQPIPQGAMASILIVTMIIESFIFIALPAIWTFFYNSRHVKLTCEWRDPVPRWTDRCPLPVLAVCLWGIYGAVVTPVSAIACNGVVPFFGTFLSGLPGMTIYFVIAVMWGISAWLLYRLDQRGWWVLLLTLITFIISGIVTYTQHDPMEMYKLMNFPEAQTEQIQKMHLLTSTSMIVMSSIFFVPVVGYLLFIKRYLR